MTPEEFVERFKGKKIRGRAVTAMGKHMLDTYLIPNGEFTKFMADKHPDGTIFYIKGRFFCKEAPEGMDGGVYIDTTLTKLDDFHEVDV